ncbi:hypothetical protein E4U42_003053 [Claviceps africana]|uniref:Uncharacterized protein n=1 Tax=Claviceps africana TaxID=83212 RepID=A0A8K0NJB5_9HYPO|nr:hypothetical protein E4U42_003053 [Claviceps africana]
MAPSNFHLFQHKTPGNVPAQNRPCLTRAVHSGSSPTKGHDAVAALHHETVSLRSESESLGRF